MRDQIKDILRSENGHLRKRIISSIFLSLIGVGALIWFLTRLFCYDGHYNSDNKINLSNAGLIGDFIGGLVGTIFSIIGILLLYETLALQRKEFKETRKVLMKEQFENTYFALINFYQDALGKISEKITPIIGEPYIISDLEYFEYKREFLYLNFTPTKSILKDSKSIKTAYTNFYLQNKTSLSIYFRTLYRIYKFIDESDFDSFTKMEYAKIFRAQLNQDELFFIYYNAYSNFGEKSRGLINKFNLTKHLPLFSKLEYKDFADKLNEVEKNSVEKIFEDLKNRIKVKIQSKQFTYHYFDYLKKRFKMTIVLNEVELKITLTINKDIPFDYTDLVDGYGLHNFTEEDIETMLKIFLKDIFEYSNFKLLNTSLKHNTSIESKENVTKIIATTVNMKGNPLQII